MAQSCLQRVNTAAEPAAARACSVRRVLTTMEGVAIIEAGLATPPDEGIDFPGMRNLLEANDINASEIHALSALSTVGRHGDVP